MKLGKKTLGLAVAAALFGVAGHANAISVTSTTDANVLANAIVGSGISISNVTLSGATSTAAGTFTGGGGLGIDTGIVLTTGIVDCVPGPNSVGNCTGGGTATSLQFDFTSTSGDVFFQYVFGSEEYNEFVGSQFNDTFELRLDGTNIALVPGGGGVVSINNVNNGSNSAYYRDNTGGGLDLQYDGLTVVLTASALGLTSGTHHFEFFITDVGDSVLDSGVFIAGGTFSDKPPENGQAPEPATLGLLGLALAGLGFSRRRKA